MIKSIRMIMAKCRHPNCPKHTYAASLEELRTYGWSVSSDKSQAACPAHAPFYNRPGRGKSVKDRVQEYMKFDDVLNSASAQVKLMGRPSVSLRVMLWNPTNVDDPFPSMYPALMQDLSVLGLEIGRRQN